jgi:hypothetical protein
MQNISALKFGRELKNGDSELPVLSSPEDRRRHDYELRKLIGTRPDGALKFNAASLVAAINRAGGPENA